jgi:hypothetical protein
MGWPIFIGQYYSLMLIGLVLGLLYPVYYFFFSQDAKSGNVDSELKKPVALIIFSLLSSIRFGFYSFLVLTIFAIVAGIVFTLWAIVSAIGT